MKKDICRCLSVLSVLALILGGFTWSTESHAAKKTSRFWKQLQEKEARSWLSLSIGGGMNVYKGEYFDEFGTYEATAETHGIVSSTLHIWIMKDLAIDLGLDGHFKTDYDTGEGELYASFRPGFRLKFLYLFYVNAGLDFLLGRRQKAFMFGMYLGGGIRIPVSLKLRLFAEFNVHFYPGIGHTPPVHGKAGFEVVF